MGKSCYHRTVLPCAVVHHFIRCQGVVLCNHAFLSFFSFFPSFPILFIVFDSYFLFDGRVVRPPLSFYSNLFFFLWYLVGIFVHPCFKEIPPRFEFEFWVLVKLIYHVSLFLLPQLFFFLTTFQISACLLRFHTVLVILCSVFILRCSVCFTQVSPSIFQIWGYWPFLSHFSKARRVCLAWWGEMS